MVGSLKLSREAIDEIQWCRVVVSAAANPIQWHRHATKTLVNENRTLMMIRYALLATVVFSAQYPEGTPASHKQFARNVLPL